MTTTRAQAHAAYEQIIGEPATQIMYEYDDQLCPCDNRGISLSDFLSSTLHVDNHCLECGGERFFETKYLKLASDTYDHSNSDPKELATRDWWHATAYNDWRDSLEAGEFNCIHVGSRLTAIHRAAELEGVDSMIKLYRLRVRDSAIWGANSPDLELSWGTLPDDMVHPYRNDFETPGYTSLFAHADAVECLGVEELDIDDLTAQVKAVRTRELEQVALA